MKRKGTLGSQAYQIKMNPDVHGVLKRRAGQLKMPIGEMIQNLLSSLEFRVKRYKEKIGSVEPFRNDELESRLMSLILYHDKVQLAEVDFNHKLETIRQEFNSRDFEPNITITDGDI